MIDIRHIEAQSRVAAREPDAWRAFMLSLWAPLPPIMTYEQAIEEMEQMAKGVKYDR